MAGRDHVESVTGFDWNHWPESMEYALADVYLFKVRISGFNAIRMSYIYC